MEYNVVRANSIPELVDAVNRSLNIGWVCQGGILGIPMGNGYFQAMTREKLKHENMSNVAVFAGHSIN